jgi:hypothetical protein
MNDPHGIDAASASSLLDAIVVLLVGWALGIVSAPVTDAIRRRSVKQRMTRAVVTELQSLQDALVGVVIQVARRRGVLTHSLLDALRVPLESAVRWGGTTRSLKIIDDLLRRDDAALATPPVPETLGVRTFLSLRVQGLPFLESHLHRLEFYSHETQRRLLEIHAGSREFDRQVEEATQYHLLTLSGGPSQSRLVELMANIETCYGRAAERASELVSQITALLQCPEMRASRQVRNAYSR